MVPISVGIDKMTYIWDSAPFLKTLQDMHVFFGVEVSTDLKINFKPIFKVVYSLAGSVSSGPILSVYYGES